MAQVEESIPDNLPEPEAVQEPTQPAETQEPVETKRGRGRPAGSKDKAPRAKPKVRAEPIPEPKAPK